MKIRLLLASLLLSVPFAAATDPLFEEEGTLPVTISADFAQIRSDRDKTETYEGQMTFGETTVPVTLTARGNNRLKRTTCNNPPLRLYINKDDVKDTVFEDQGELKLVVQCKNTGRFAEYLRLEYLAYHLFATISPESFRVRWLDLTIVDGDKTMVQPAFFIERKKRMGKRLSVSQVHENKVKRADLNARAAANLDLFQYMISNLDYSAIQGPPGEDCCHNAKLMAPDDGEGGAIPIPYDFDNSGFVDAPYAVPPDALNLNSVTVRRYRGFCAFNDELDAARANFIAQKETVMAVVNDDALLAKSPKRKATRFLDKFYDTLENDKKYERNIKGRCR